MDENIWGRKRNLMDGKHLGEESIWGGNIRGEKDLIGWRHLGRKTFNWKGNFGMKHLGDENILEERRGRGMKTFGGGKHLGSKHSGDGEKNLEKTLEKTCWEKI